MTYLPFRTYHLLALLKQYEEQEEYPLDLCIHHYFRSHKALGPKDRGFIAETLYGLIRWKTLIDHLTYQNSDPEIRIQTYLNHDMLALSKDEKISLPTRISFPQELFDAFVRTYGQQRAIELCRICNFPAPTTIRINPLKTTRKELFNQWKERYQISYCKFSSLGIIFQRKINFFGLDEFKQGLFEVQDEGSQLLAGLVQPKPGDQILDYCAGSGGKTLAFASQMQNKGQIFLHDVRTHALMEAKKRLKRAGVQNAQVLKTDELNKLKKIKKQMDWVLVDAPCSGTGTLRRNPDMKWKYDEAMLLRLTGLQRQIFEKALSFLKPDGKIVYATCSILKEENEEQLEHFIKTYNLEVYSPPFQSLPSQGGMDGFFGVVLHRK